jgi:hypothetical protein
MGGDLYTDGLQATEEVSERIGEALAELNLAFPDQAIQLLRWSDSYVAIPLVVNVELPSRGPVDNLDIREQEPIILLLHQDNYPFKDTWVFSNRLDFPKTQLPHLNPLPGLPASLCLHRRTLHEWMAEHTILDLVERARGWLRDAARDRLIPPGDNWEATRIETPLGITIYEASDVTNYVQQHWIASRGQAGFTHCLFRLLSNPEDDPLIGEKTYAIELLETIAPKKLSQRLRRSQDINTSYNHRKEGDRLAFGILVWPSSDAVCSTYFAEAELPKVLEQFLDWADELGLSVRRALQSYSKHDLQLFGGIPVIVTIPRPWPIIGTESALELLNIVIVSPNQAVFVNGRWNKEAKVLAMQHRSPLTVSRARHISNRPDGSDVGKLLVIGCGVIGSKLALHLARAGITDMTLVDSDELSPHNMVRHALLPDSVGKNKARALGDTIQSIFRAERIGLNVVECNGIDILIGSRGKLLHQHTWLIDATASVSLMQAINATDLPSNLRYCRCELAYEGKLGLFTIEGAERNPRVDDVRAILFDMACEEALISHWLQANQSRQDGEVGFDWEELRVGMGCSSETMRLSDDSASFHASSFAIGFRHYAGLQDHRNGYLQISQNGGDAELLAAVRQFEVQPMTIIPACNDAAWQVRLKYGLESQLLDQLKAASPSETGGILIGSINSRKKLIVITRVLPAPPDSKSSPYAFVRGVKDVPESVRQIESLTGGMLGYVGEWHTHPMGGERLSSTDLKAVNDIRRILDTIPLPTHVMIVTPQGIHPHIFAP